MMRAIVVWRFSLCEAGIAFKQFPALNEQKTWLDFLSTEVFLGDITSDFDLI